MNIAHLLSWPKNANEISKKLKINFFFSLVSEHCVTIWTKIWNGAVSKKFLNILKRFFICVKYKQFLVTRETPAFGGISLALHGNGAFGGGKRFFFFRGPDEFFFIRSPESPRKRSNIVTKALIIPRRDRRATKKIPIWIISTYNTFFLLVLSFFCRTGNKNSTDCVKICTDCVAIMFESRTQKIMTFQVYRAHYKQE